MDCTGLHLAVVLRYDQTRLWLLTKIRNVASYIVACTILLALCWTPMLDADTEVGGVMNGEITWSAANSPFAVTQNVEVPTGGTLLIEPGVEVRFDRFSLIVKGEIVARGSDESPILLTSNKPTPEPGDWLFVQLMTQSVPAKFGAEGKFVSGSVLEHCIIEYGAGLNLVGASPLITHCTIRHNYSEEGGGIFSGGGSPVIQNNRIAYNRCNRDGGGIRSANGHPKILGNQIICNTARGRGGGIATNYSSSTIRGEHHRAQLGAFRRWHRNGCATSRRNFDDRTIAQQATNREQRDCP